MVTKAVPLPDHPLNYLWVFGNLRTKYEECRTNRFPREKVQQLRGIHRIRAIVEGQYETLTIGRSSISFDSVRMLPDSFTLLACERARMIIAVDPGYRLV